MISDAALFDLIDDIIAVGRHFKESDWIDRGYFHDHLADGYLSCRFEVMDRTIILALRGAAYFHLRVM